MELMQASQQWASRPDDERFTSLTEMLNFSTASRLASVEQVIPNRLVEARPVENDHRGLGVALDGEIVTPTHWAFGQLAQKVGAPPSYLRKLPAPIAADAINYGLKFNAIEEMGTLTRSGVVRAFTGPSYGRIYNDAIIGQLVNRFGDGVTGDFRVPGEFGVEIEVNKKNTTLYTSDRNMFVFLADEKNRIEIPNRRNGQSGEMARGFFVWNSEVGSTTYGLASFLFDYVCTNRIVWGAAGYEEIRIRHTSSAPLRFIEEMAPAIEEYASSSTGSIVKAIEDARSKRIGDTEKVEEFLNSRFTKTQAKAIQFAHIEDEGRPIETLWDVTTGITAYARTLKHQDERVKLERQGGAILDLAA